MMRLSLLGSTGWLGSTYPSSRLPLPLVSRMNGDQPCEAASSPVSKNFLVLSQPTTGARAPPAENQSVLLASSANAMWWVVKQRSTCVSLSVLGSYIAACRGAVSVGNSFADG